MAGISRVCTGYSNNPDIVRYTHFLPLMRCTSSLRIAWEFQALRAQLPGIHRVRDEVMHELRQENAQLQQQLQTAQEQLRATALSELDEAIRMIELLEEENLHLRGEVKRLRKQLEKKTHVVVHVPADRSLDHGLTIVSSGKGPRDI